MYIPWYATQGENTIESRRDLLPQPSELHIAIIITHSSQALRVIALCEVSALVSGLGSQP